MNNTDISKLNAVETYVQESLKSSLRKYSYQLQGVQFALKAFQPCLINMLEFAKANAGKKLGPKMTARLLSFVTSEAVNKELTKEDELREFFSSLQVYFTWERRYSFLKTPEFILEVQATVNTPCGPHYFSKYLGAWGLTLRENEVYENVISGGFIRLIEEIVAIVKWEQNKIATVLEKFEESSNALLKANEKTLQTLREEENILAEMRVANMSLGTLVSSSKVLNL